VAIPLKVARELFQAYSGLLEDATERSGRQFAVKRYDATYITLCGLLLEDYMTASLSDPYEAKLFEGMNCLLTGNAARFRHG
jgi:hypothetical protein